MTETQRCMRERQAEAVSLLLAALSAAHWGPMARAMAWAPVSISAHQVTVNSATARLGQSQGAWVLCAGPQEGLDHRSYHTDHSQPPGPWQGTAESIRSGRGGEM